MDEGKPDRILCMGNGEGESSEDGYEDRVVSVSESKRSEEEREKGLGVRPRSLRTELASSGMSCSSAILAVVVGGKSKAAIAWLRKVVGSITGAVLSRQSKNNREEDVRTWSVVWSEGK